MLDEETGLRGDVETLLDRRFLHVRRGLRAVRGSPRSGCERESQRIERSPAAWLTARDMVAINARVSARGRGRPLEPRKLRSRTTFEHEGKAIVDRFRVGVADDRPRCPTGRETAVNDAVQNAIERIRSARRPAAVGLVLLAISVRLRPSTGRPRRAARPRTHPRRRRAAAKPTVNCGRPTRRRSASPTRCRKRSRSVRCRCMRNVTLQRKLRRPRPRIRRSAAIGTTRWRCAGEPRALRDRRRHRSRDRSGSHDEPRPAVADFLGAARAGPRPRCSRASTPKSRRMSAGSSPPSSASRTPLRTSSCMPSPGIRRRSYSSPDGARAFSSAARFRLARWLSPVYRTRRIQSVPGATLVLYTDGAVEHSRNVLEGEEHVAEGGGAKQASRAASTRRRSSTGRSFRAGRSATTSRSSRSASPSMPALGVQVSADKASSA